MLWGKKCQEECWKIGWSGIFPIKNDIQAGSREPSGDQEDRGNCRSLGFEVAPACCALGTSRRAVWLQ